MNFFKNILKFLFSKQFLLNLGILLMVYILVVIGTIYYLDSKTKHGEKIEVPNYIGKNMQEISSELDKLSLQYEVVDSIYDPSKTEGTIVFQNPQPSNVSDVYVKKGRKIRFRVSKKTKLIEIPLLVDRSERYANSVLKNMGINAVITYQPSLEATGAVLQQKYKNKNMENGQKIPVGATVYLIIGEGYSTETMSIPDLSCMTINQVKSRFDNSTIRILENYLNCRTKEDSLNAKVVFQSPAYQEGEVLQNNTDISITLDAKACY